MDPVTEHRLRRWLDRELEREGQSLRKTSPGDPNYARLGRYSRWSYDKFRHATDFVEGHVDLEDLASRVRAYLNSLDLRLR